MELLFIDTMRKAIDMPHLYLHFGVNLGLWVLVLLAVLIDLWDGVMTAKKLHRRVHSHKLRVTVTKMGEYWRIMLLGFVADCVGVLFPVYNLPYLSILICIGIIGIEMKSVWEHAKKRKSKAAELPAILRSMVECANEHNALEIVERISDYLDDEKKK